MPRTIPRRFLDFRWLPAYAAVVGLPLLARPEPASLAVGAVLMGLGAGIRVWGLGHLVKTDRLIRSGPYAYVRHPLYAGTLLIGLGLFVAAGGWASWLAAGILLPLFFLYYLPYKERIESARLERRYGDTYRAYRAEVPQLFPRGRRWPPVASDSEGPPCWSAGRFRASSEGWTLLALVVGLGALAARAALA